SSISVNPDELLNSLRLVRIDHLLEEFKTRLAYIWRGLASTPHYAGTLRTGWASNIVRTVCAIRVLTCQDENSAFSWLWPSDASQQPWCPSGCTAISK